MPLPKHIVDLNAIDELGPTFIGLQLLQLSDIIDFQGNELFRTRGLDLPSRSTSTLLFISKKAATSVTDLAAFFGISHQLVGLRIKSLKANGLVAEKRDPADSRRTLISLTTRGQSVARRVEDLCRDLENVFRDVFEEVGVDLFDALILVKSALARRGLSDRLS